MNIEKCFVLLYQEKLKFKTGLNIVCFSCNLKKAKQNIQEAFDCVTQNKSLKRGCLLWIFFMLSDHKLSAHIMAMVLL